MGECGRGVIPWVASLGLLCGWGQVTAAAPIDSEAPVSKASEPLGVEACVTRALADNARVEEVEARVHQFEARLAEVESAYYPKLSATAFVAPMFRVHGNGFHEDWTYHWKSIRDWGPHTNLEMLLAQPFWTFGRVEAGAEAVRERAEVERGRLREAAAAVALEVRKLYYTHVFTLSMRPVLQQAIAAVTQALAHAQTLYDEGSGEVTAVEVGRLEYGLAEAQRYLAMAEEGSAVSMAALRHTMGLAADEPLTLADTSLPTPADDADGEEKALSLTVLLRQAATDRPEWSQLEHGRRAALALEHAERLANMPVAFLAAQVHWAWSPMRDRDSNPWHYDDQNTFTGGVAVGLRLDLDAALANAKANTARAQGEELEALRRFAATGIPFQVRRAHDDRELARRVVKIARGSVVATRKWLTSADQAYQSGTGEARDLLEGLVAHVQAKRTYYENLQAYHVASAELRHAIGGQ